MMGILHGAWIVGESWVTACAAAGCPVLEEPHEVVGDANGNLQGPILGRLQRPAKLLHGTEVLLIKVPLHCKSSHLRPVRILSTAFDICCCCT